MQINASNTKLDPLEKMMGFFDKLFRRSSDIIPADTSELTLTKSSEISNLPDSVKRGPFSKGRPKKCNADNLSKLPNRPGVYRHRNRETNEIEYVGQTNNIARRNRQHLADGRLDMNKHTVEWMEASQESTRDDWCTKEQAHISRHKPKGNKSRGGNGRR